jgi:hypothetical protein
MKKVLGLLAIALIAIGLVIAPQVQAAEVKYEFKPPQNNFYYKWKSGDKTQYAGYINGGLWSDDGNRQKFSTPDGKNYYYSGGKWKLDEIADSGDVKAWIAQYLAEPEFLGAYYVYFWKRHNAAADGKLQASQYYKGKEQFLGINCDIFVDKRGAQYWIDPANGGTLKRVSADGKKVEEMVEYNLNFTRFPAGLPTQAK